MLWQHFMGTETRTLSQGGLRSLLPETGADGPLSLLLPRAEPNLRCSNYHLNSFFVDSPESPRCSCHATQVPGNEVGSPISLGV